jgi:hypothetical protein
MNNDKNTFDITGTLYAKDNKIVPNTKDTTKPPWEFRSIILEMKTYSGEKVYTDLPQFQLGNGVGYDEFEIGDFINVRFSLSGKKISDTWHKTELRATFIKHADLQSNDIKSKIAMNTETNRKPVKVDDHIPVPEEREIGDTDDGLNDLPF